MATIRLEGDKELIRAFTALDQRAAKAIGRKAARAGGAPLVKRVKENLRSVLSSESRSVRLNKAERRDLGDKQPLLQSIKMRIRVRGGEASASVSTAPHGHLMEFGTNERFYYPKVFGSRLLGRITRGAHNTGKMPARPFARPAFDSMQDQTASAIEAKMWEGIQAEWSK
jgi:HK97 gp10 family phage protein